MTEDEKKERLRLQKKLLEEAEEKRVAAYNDPENVVRRDQLKQVWHHDIDKLAHFTALVLQENARLHEVNKELSDKLDELSYLAGVLNDADGVDPHIKVRIANMFYETDPANFVAEVFRKSLVTGNSITASKNGSKKHAKYDAAKEMVRVHWQKYQGEYKSNKSAFARIYCRLVSQQFGVQITEKQMREVWLKNPPPAGKPDGLLAGG